MFFKKIFLDSAKKFEIIDLTSMINDEISIENGVVNIFSKHSTSSILINENESGLLEDLELFLDELFHNHSWKHNFIDDNAESHLKSFILPSSETIPISNYKMDLGTWQSVFFVELDGPRKNRCVNLTFIDD